MFTASSVCLRVCAWACVFVCVCVCVCARVCLSAGIRDRGKVHSVVHIVSTLRSDLPLQLYQGSSKQDVK